MRHFLLILLCLFSCVHAWEGDECHECDFDRCEEEHGEPLFRILPSPGKEQVFFRVFTTVLGFLDQFEIEKNWAGIRVDFDREGLYYTRTHGPNWWRYYFRELELGSFIGARRCVLRDVEIRKSHVVGRRLSRQRGHDLIVRHIRVHDEIEDFVEQFVRKKFKHFFIIGVHFSREIVTGVIDPDERRERIRNIICIVRRTIQKIPSERFKIFVATEDQAFLDEMRAHFKGKILYIDALRSDNENLFKLFPQARFEIGQQTLIDCLLLARTDILVAEESSLTFWALRFNPTLPHVRVIDEDEDE